jgi:GDPmannose 4,6-dehydratase
VKRALVTGVAGQDGIHLARRLRDQGVAVTGVVSGSVEGSQRVATYAPEIDVVTVDLRDTAALRAVVEAVAPDEIYNLAAISSVARSWREPALTQAVNATAVEVLVTAAVAVQDRYAKEVRFFQASSAEVTEGAAESPYARSKRIAEEAVVAAREERGLHACVARLYIHESPLRPAGFVSRKITNGVAAIATGRDDRLTLGNLDVVRDWGYAGDYMDAVRRLLLRDEPADLPIGTGVPHSLADLVATAFAAAGLDDHEQYVVQDPDLIRPVDTPVLVADPEPARKLLGWQPEVGFTELIGRMVAVDIERLRTGVAENARYLQAAPGLRA